MRMSDWSSDVCSSDLTCRLSWNRGECDEHRNGRQRTADHDALTSVEQAIEGTDTEDAGDLRHAHPEQHIAARHRTHTVHVVKVRTRPQPEHGHHAGIGEAIDRKEHTSELQSLMRISYAVFCLKKKKIHS